MSNSTDVEREQVRGIVRRWGWNGTSYQILNTGFNYWLHEEHDAVVGFVLRNGIRVVGGGPVCADSKLGAVMEAFEADAAAAGEGTTYFCAEDRLALLAAGDARRTTFPIGAQPCWSPQALLHRFGEHASLRAQLNRAMNKRLQVRLLPGVDAATSKSLQRCLHEWVDSRGLPPLHFLVETETLDDLVDRCVFVAEQGTEVLAYLVATPIPARKGWLVEQIVRSRAAPNGTSELLIHHAAGVLSGLEARMMTLGLAPLAERGSPVVNRAPRWLGPLLGRLRAHGRRFFNFEGLEAFKAKFGESRWESVYTSLAPGTSLPRALVAITTAFSGESLYRFAPRTLGHALGQEWERLRSRAG